MKKAGKIIFILVSIILSIQVIIFTYWPFALRFINDKMVVGDSLMHLANLISITRDHSFPIMSWRAEWGGYPLIEGYPWVHYYLIQPFLSFFNSPGLAMDYYMSIFLFFYFTIGFLLLFYVSRNVFLALLFTLVLIYGADSQMPLSVNAFMTFAASQFFLPLILLLIILARERNSKNLFLLASIFLSVAFYSHGAMTGIVIIPLLLPFLILNKKGKISKESIFNTLQFFIVFTLISSIQVYQFIDYNAQGYLRGVKPFPIDIIPSRLLSLLSWQNPVLLLLLLVFVPLFLIILFKKKFSNISAYFFSSLFILFIFTLMLFNITSMNLVLLAERVLWGISLSFLLLFSITVRELSLGVKKQVAVGAVSLLFLSVYLFVILIVKPAHFIPDTLRAYDPYHYTSVTKEEIQGKKQFENLSSKFDLIYSYPSLPWISSFDNYRTDGLSWSIYSNWNIWSSNPRYKGRFPAAKRLPLEWSGIQTASLYGKLGEAGSTDTTKWSINQTLFFLDWYGIRRLEIAENDLELVDFLTKKPLISKTEKRENTKSITSNLIYHNLDEKYVGPIYSPTNANTIAVISPEKQYDAFIRILSYSEFNSSKLIPIYLGPSLNSLNKDNIKFFDSVFVYGYTSSLFGTDAWNILADFVKEGGKLIIETGQKVPESEKMFLPEVFPIDKTKISVINKSFNVEVKENELTRDIDKSLFNPLQTKYLPYLISETEIEALRGWAKPVLMKDGKVMMAWGKLGEGSVVWSGLNLPFHAIDNRNVSETIIFGNILNSFFPNVKTKISVFKVEHPKPEKIIVHSNQGKGFLIKENYNPGWRANLNGKSTNIYKAGLFQMYVPFNEKATNQRLELTYLGNPLHWFLFVVSFLSLIAVLVYIIFNKHPLTLVKKVPKPRIKLMSNEDENY